MTDPIVLACSLPDVSAFDLDSMEAVEVGPGCSIRTVALPAGGEAWVVDIDPGARWPEDDVHDGLEVVYVMSGELIEGDVRYPAGSLLVYRAGSSHRPRTDSGVRLVGVNVA